VTGARLARALSFAGLSEAATVSETGSARRGAMSTSSGVSTISAVATETIASESSRCEALNARGERCGKRAVRGRFCLVHAGAQDMAEIGRRGGRRSPLTRLRRAVRDDEELRAKAKAALEAALDGDDEKRRFEAAKSLYSFRAAAPPAGEQARDQQDEARMHVLVRRADDGRGRARTVRADQRETGQLRGGPGGGPARVAPSPRQRKPRLIFSRVPSRIRDQERASTT
jgi:hypothetical protein